MRFIKDFLADHLFGLILFIVFFIAALWAVSSVQTTDREQSRRIAEDGIRRAVVSCYAIEGAYPESLDYLKENYGLSIDESRYTVIYNVFASNLMPDITVIEK
ncbi:MAG: hypothetical protein ACI4J1_00595 [Ruminiclostridium sp.]